MSKEKQEPVPALRNKWKKLRVKHYLPEDEVEAVWEMLYHSWKGVKSYELAIILGCHWRNYSYVRKVLNKVAKEYGVKIYDHPYGKNARIYTLEENYTREKAYKALKAEVSNAWSAGLLKYPDALDAYNQKVHEEAEDRAAERLKEKELKQEESRKAKVKADMEWLGGLFADGPRSVASIAEEVDYTTAGIKKIFQKFIENGYILKLKAGGKGRGNSAIWDLSPKGKRLITKLTDLYS